MEVLIRREGAHKVMTGGAVVYGERPWSIVLLFNAEKWLLGNGRWC